MSAPASVGFFADREFYVNAPASALLARRLARFEGWARGRMVRQTPCDAIISPGVDVPYVAGRGFLGGSFLVATPTFPSRRLKVWAYGFTGSAYYCSYTFVSRRTGAVLGTVYPGNTQWLSTTLSLDAPDVIDIYLPISHDITSNDHALSAYWLPEPPSGAYIETVWTPLSQTFMAGDRALCAYALRWLGRRANQLTVERSSQVLAATHYTTTDVAGHGWVFRVASRVPSLTVKVYAMCTGGTAAMHVGYADPPSYAGNDTWSSADQTVPNDATWRWYTFSIPCNWTESNEIRVNVWGTGSLAYLHVASVSVVEDKPTTSTLGLPGSQTVPSSYSTLTDALWISGTPLRASDYAALVANMIWLWSVKTRQLVSWSNPSNYYYDGQGTEPRKSTRGIYRFVGTDDGWIKEMRLRAASRLTGTRGQQYICWASWTDDNSQSPGSSYKELQAEIPGSAAAWLSVPGHYVSPNQEWVYRRKWGNPQSDGSCYVAHLAGALEEMPDGTSLTGWP